MKKIKNTKKGFIRNSMCAVIATILTLTSFVMPCLATTIPNAVTENNNQIIAVNDICVNSKLMLAYADTCVRRTVDEKINTFIKDPRWKEGASWGERTPIINDYCKSWTGCAAYCCDFVKYVYGIKSPRSGNIYYNINDIRRGDVVRIGDNNHQHWFVVLGRDGNKLYVAERSGAKIKVGWNYNINTSKNRFNEDSRTFQYAWHYTDKRPFISVPSTPSKVTGLKVTNATKTSISLSWKKVSGSNIKYEIYDNGNYIATTTGTTYTHSGLKGYSCHTYQVRATVQYEDWDYSIKTLKGQFSVGLIQFTKKK